MTYDNAKSIKYKVDFVKKNNQLGGVMFWQFNGDNGTLLNTIFNNLYTEK
ncbi:MULTISPECIES: glycosyl hydrolase family 18 protein [unclassified Aquimarina]